MSRVKPIWCGNCWIQGKNTPMKIEMRGLPLCLACEKKLGHNAIALEDAREKWEAMPDFRDEDREIESNPNLSPRPDPDPVPGVLRPDASQQIDQIKERAAFIEQISQQLTELECDLSADALEQFRDAAMIGLAIKTIDKYGNRLQRRIEELTKENQ